MDYPLSTSEIYTENEANDHLPLFITLNHGRHLLRLFFLSSVVVFLLSLLLVIFY